MSLTNSDFASKNSLLICLFVSVVFIEFSLEVNQPDLNANDGMTLRQCATNFEGFGIHLGDIGQLNQTTDSVIEKVVDLVYNDLQLRHFRTSYEPDFSLSENVYDISCRTAFSCTWNKVHKIIAKYPSTKIFASVWSPPHYMKNKFLRLKSDYEDKYYYFIKNITKLMKEEFNHTIEVVSIINEPDNLPASWDHTIMGPNQLCGIVERFGDPLISACPENSWFPITKLYKMYNVGGINCQRACKITLTHAYALNFDVTSPNFLLAYYDNVEYQPLNDGTPIWQTEVCSTYYSAEENQMLEAMDLATNIVQFVGTTCVSRYYFWRSFSIDPSGESIMWVNSSFKLLFPKKYFVYKHFTKGAMKNPDTKVRRCDQVFIDGLCIQFGDGNSPAVFVNKNKNSSAKLLVSCSKLCCTTEKDDYECSFADVVPAYSVCSCDSVKEHNNDVYIFV